jgi:hypothetical protein
VREIEVVPARSRLGPEVGALADRQKGLVRHGQLVELGVSRNVIARAVARGWLRPKHRGVYAVGHTALPKNADEMAAWLAMGDRAPVSIWSAGAAQGYLKHRPDQVHVTVVGRRRASRDGIVVHCVPRLALTDTIRFDGIPMTSAARTVVDLAANGLAGRRLARAVAEACRTKLTSVDAIQAALDRSPNPRGKANLAATIATGANPAWTRSDGEEAMLKLIDDFDLPKPDDVNVPCGPYEIDFLWGDLAVEVDSWSFHGDTMAFEDDRRKDAYLQSRNLRPQRVTGRQLKHERGQVAVRIALAIRRTAGPAGS